MEIILRASLLACLCTHVHAFAGHVTMVTEQYNHKAVFSTGNYTLYWKTNATTITFEAHVRTQGWVGLGFTKDGAMYPGDAVIGYVSGDGKGSISDYHTVGHRPPMMDSQQDYVLLASRQVNTGTMLKFSRSLDTKDSNDWSLQTGVTFVIWAYGDADPDANGAPYHGVTRGARQLRLVTDSVSVGK